MVEHETVDRAWLVEIVPDQVRLRCFYRRRGKWIFQYTVQLEIFANSQWRPVVRYDNAHGFGHCDTLHADGSPDKTPVYYGNTDETFTRSIDEMQSTWAAHQSRFLKELEND